VNITVLLGGASAERDVSLASGIRVIDALRSNGHRVTAVDPTTGVLRAADEQVLRGTSVRRAPPSLEELAGLSRSERQEFSPVFVEIPEIRNADVVFIGLHGGKGEDGTLQALLDLAGVPYTGSGHLASALAMDKDLSKILFRAAGVGTADWIMAPARADAIERALGFPVVVKPSKQGSTVGLTVVREPGGLQPAISEAFRYDDEVMIEAFIAGRELTVGVLGDEALPVGEIFPAHDLYDYECKYTPGMAREEFPARLTAAETSMLQEMALRAFRSLKLSGYARIDFRLSEPGEAFCLEANTLPGVTGTSLIPQAAAARGMSFAELCERIVQLAGLRGRLESRRTESRK
jgi:D-alanine-D-alanine ligase